MKIRRLKKKKRLKSLISVKKYLFLLLLVGVIKIRQSHCKLKGSLGDQEILETEEQSFI